jgi:hypothetical protein
MMAALVSTYYGIDSKTVKIKHVFSFVDAVVLFQDNVFVTVVASIQYRALADKASDAFYKLTNTKQQIQSYVFDGMALHCAIPIIQLLHLC